eukprot:gb/GEZN01005485.1/.p1 GENE.gb/GEZN01005485.1/~~gb/GEZN01005485.1/.p1  ORF type:complete len:317 (+),score=39.38 gb/GEZN01005485.1/:197-1147(+)
MRSTKASLSKFQRRVGWSAWEQDLSSHKSGLRALNRYQLADHEWKSAGVALMRMKNQKPFLLLCQEAESQGYWKLFEFDLPSAQRFEKNFRLRIETMSTARLTLMAAWSYEDFCKHWTAYTQAPTTSGNPPDEEYVLRAQDTSIPFDFGTVASAEEGEITEELWKSFVALAQTELAMREKSRRDMPRRWGIPKGRKDSGEACLQTAVREFTEETGLGDERMVLLPDSGVLVGHVAIFPAWFKEPPGSVAGLPMEWQPNNTEVACCRFWSLEDLQEMPRKAHVHKEVTVESFKHFAHTCMHTMATTAITQKDSFLFQ